VVKKNPALLANKLPTTQNIYTCASLVKLKHFFQMWIYFISLSHMHKQMFVKALNGEGEMRKC
jgi:hypothetical protein